MARDHSDVGVGTFVFVWPLRSITFVRVDILYYATLRNVFLDSVIQLILWEKSISFWFNYRRRTQSVDFFFD